MTTAPQAPAAPSRARAVTRAIPSIALAASIASVAFLVSRWVVQIPLNPIMIAVILGALVSSVAGSRPWITRGLDTLPRLTLRLAIVLLGFHLSLSDILNIGNTGLFVIAVATVTTILIAIAAGRALGIDRDATLLIAAGTSICGVAAILSMATAIRAGSRDITYAIVCITVFGLISMLLFPLAGHMLGLDPRLFGIWTGGAVHEVAQVVAAGFQYGNAAGETATITKLARVLLLAPVVTAVAFSIRRSGAQSSVTFMPWFVAGFLIAVGINSAIAIPGEVRAWITLSSSLLFTFALAAIGLTINLRQLVSGRSRELILGLIATVWISVASLAAALLSKDW